jgi:hypothetical protein
MTTTVRDLITDALIESGAQAIGEPVRAEDAQFALRTLNRMLESWNTDYGMIYSLNRLEFDFIANQQKYTIGTLGDFNMSRPVRIDMVSVLMYGTSPEVETQILSDEEWRAIPVKSITSNLPTKVWFSGNVPYQEAYFWPTPTDASYKAVLYCWGKTSEYTSLDTVMTFPNGYEEAILSNLALMLCSSFGIQPNPVLAERAMMAKSSLRSINSEAPYIQSDSGLLSGVGSSNAIKTFGLLVDRT